MEWLPPVFNFLVVVFILVYFGRKPMAAFLVTRSETVANDIQTAEAESQRAMERLEVSQRNWDNSRAHATQQMEEAKSAMARLRESTLKSAHEEAARVKKESRLVGQSEASRAKSLLQKEVVEKSVRMAESYLTGHLSDKDRQKLVSEYVEIVGNGAT